MPGTSAIANVAIAEPTQLALALDHAESFAREDFLAGPSNAAALALIERWPDWPSRTVLLRGPEGSGKSHLAAIWARAAGARMLSPRALDGADVPVALATGALVLEDLAEGAFDEARAVSSAQSRARGARLCPASPRAARRPSWRIAAARSRLAAARAAGGRARAARRRAAARGAGQAVRRPAARGRREPDRLSSRPGSSARSRPPARRWRALDREALRQKRPVTRALAGELFRGCRRLTASLTGRRSCHRAVTKWRPCMRPSRNRHERHG